MTFLLFVLSLEIYVGARWKDDVASGFSIFEEKKNKGLIVIRFCLKGVCSLHEVRPQTLPVSALIMLAAEMILFHYSVSLALPHFLLLFQFTGAWRTRGAEGKRIMSCSNDISFCFSFLQKWNQILWHITMNDFSLSKSSASYFWPLLVIILSL